MEKNTDWLAKPLEWITYEDSIATDDLYINEGMFARGVLEYSDFPKGYLVKIIIMFKHGDKWFATNRSDFMSNLADAKASVDVTMRSLAREAS